LHFHFYPLRFLPFPWILSWTPSYQHKQHLISFINAYTSQDYLCPTKNVKGLCKYLQYWKLSPHQSRNQQSPKFVPHAPSTIIVDFWPPFRDFLDFEMIQVFFTTNVVIPSLIYMKSYKLVVLMLWEAKLGTLAPTSFGFRKLYATTRSGNNVWQSYSQVVCNGLSLLTNRMTSPKPL
jgi:hypothetical protein